MSESSNDYRPTVDDVDPSALAVNSLDDDVRVSADPSETEIVDSGGETLRVDEAEGDESPAPHRSAASDGDGGSERGEA